MSPTIKLTYFNAPGRAEPIRLALTTGGISFEDERIDGDTFATLKANSKLPFSSLPIVTVDGDVFAESNAILRFAGKLAGLYPKCEKAALKVDMVVDALESVILALYADKTADGRKKFVEDVIPRYLGRIDAMYEKAKGAFLLGDEMSIADIKLAAIVEAINGGEVENVPKGCVDKYPHMKSAVKAVWSNEKIKTYKTKA